MPDDAKFEIGDIVEVRGDDDVSFYFRAHHGATSTGPYKVAGSFRDFLRLETPDGKEFVAPDRFFVRRSLPLPEGLKLGGYVIINATKQRELVRAVNPNRGEVLLRNYQRLKFTDVTPLLHS